MAYHPRFNITISMAKNLMKIQHANTLAECLPLPSHIVKDLKTESMMETVFLSTKIEGNMLDEKKKRAALRKIGATSEEQEVYNLWKAMEFLECNQKENRPISEKMVKELHAIIQVISSGRRPKISEYRTSQNKVADNRSGMIVYLPPEWQDVPVLMEDLIAWINSPACREIPAPIKAGIFLYQFLTIHPYLDGNGRTGRALATYILRTSGLDLRGLFVLEKYYDRNLKGYYENLQMGLHHNYYFGRNDPDLTPWLEFFISGVAEVFTEAARIISEKSSEFTLVEPELLRNLDPYQKPIFAQLAFKFNYLTTTDLRRLTGLSDRTVRDKVKGWIADGFLEPYDKNAQRIRAVTLSPEYKSLAEAISEEPERYLYLLK